MHGKLSNLTNPFNTDTERDRGRIGDAQILLKEKENGCHIAK